MEPTQEWPFLIFVIGCPGSGKGTLCKKLEKDFDCIHVSIGDVLRSICSQPGEENSDVTQYVREGKLVPTEILFRVIKSAVFGGLVKDQRVLLADGFPRQIEQCLAAESLELIPDLVLFVDCDKDIAKERFLARQLDGRLDDDEELFGRRYEQFVKLNPALISHYSAQDKLVKINSEGKTEVTYKMLPKALGSRKEWAEVQAEEINELMERLLN